MDGESNPKRIDPDLPFYYSTSAHGHFYMGEKPDFNSKPSNLPRPKRLPRYELLGAKNRVDCHSVSTQAKFHNLAIDLPPPPGKYNHLLNEYLYSTQK